MTVIRADVLVIGSGFGGSLAALMAHQRGRRVILMDRARHPRFAIGESSTPIANLLLERIAVEYDLPWLRPFARYGEWKRAYPHVPCGPKRGFAYVHHEAGRHFVPRGDRANELLVGSNPDEARADCQWVRADFDAFVFGQACQAGVTCFEQAAIESMHLAGSHEGAGSKASWRVTGDCDNQPFVIDADFIVDATGAGILSHTLDIPHDLSGIRTCSRTIYSHFEGVRPWRDLCTTPAYSTTDHPFPIDDATLHHVFDGGWMWVIRFDNGIASAGFCLEPDTFPMNESIGAADEWSALIAQFPSIREQFADARPVLPFTRTGRMQRSVARAAGADWAMLPTTAGFVDAFFSTGNAHTLLGVIRLAEILTRTDPGRKREERLGAYDRMIRREIEAIDRLVHGCYRSFHNMNLLAAYSMLYFLAATYSEERLRSGASAADAGFLLADDDSFQNIVREFHARLGRGLPVAQGCDIEKTSLLRVLREQTAAYNVAGLCDAGKRNMYPYSVA